MKLCHLKDGVHSADHDVRLWVCLGQTMNAPFPPYSHSRLSHRLPVFWGQLVTIHMRQFTGDNYYILPPSHTGTVRIKLVVARIKEPLKTKFTVREEESPGNSRTGAMVVWSCMEAGTGRSTSTAGICGASFTDVSPLQPEQLLLNPPPTGKFCPHFLPLTQLLNSGLVNSDWEWVTLVWKMAT